VADLRQIIQTYVRLVGDEPDGEPRQATVKVSAPTWMTVLTPSSVQVTVRQRRQAGGVEGPRVFVPVDGGGEEVPFQEPPREGNKDGGDLNGAGGVTP
jgi:hypothetical protein